jgi:uncharacterized membrane protein
MRGQAILTLRIGYVHYIEMTVIQTWAEEVNARVVITALLGTFYSPDRAVAYVSILSGDCSEIDFTCVDKAFQIGDDSLFEDDPRFGLVVLSGLAGLALSPAVNDPGSAIKIIGTMVRLFALWNEPEKGSNEEATQYDRIAVP